MLTELIHEEVGNCIPNDFKYFQWKLLTELRSELEDPIFFISWRAVAINISRSARRAISDA